ncbi:helicase C-terminal domain-containing protein [Histoplasma capsulatum G186AR]|uniref:ATP-dependent DNA helicase n=2 Tax=Ajellomyces capsulatus TaxID=5037 RepID=C0NBZ8_AJECG|nr:helicase C-terminal domain-containing protein [Histoplasma capsulatum G186AR]EEH11189.1 helicase C-terminal domain-containing protein [Histoplasma capsulatum G186AR]KAG5302966.1 helicase C-terminal domain-containing protein [Histoplasma capsulatum]QSS71634.1 helicase C-terminal domain-containing protein [Histoplasma capsulatum G186AR]
MSSSEFSDFDDDDILPVVNDATSADFSAASSDSSRAPKRRRLSHSQTSDKRDARTSWGTLSGTGHESGHESGQSQDTLPSLHRAPVARHRDEINTKPTGPKYKIYQPKHPRAQEPTFVTQLTQPPSSPSIIRGPRWKKPGPEDLAVKRAPTPVIDRSRNIPETNNNDMDGDLRVAIAASLESFRRENKGDMGPCPNPKERKSPVSSNSNFGPQDAFFDIGDIPEDAFDSSLDSSSGSPQKTPVLVPSSQPFPSQSSFRRQGSSQQKNLRQMTLFGGPSQTIKPSSSSQSISHNWPFVSRNEPPTHHRLDSTAIKSWVYPTNLGKKREYQFNITQRALFHNLLVALPTGLGKTFIAATVMLNWFRWTTDAQIVFVAPTKPLVSQQIVACFGIAGIPRSQTVMLTGSTGPAIRAAEWQSKRVFFMTPQTLVNDLKNGHADPKRIVLLVIDEAHRATGGYAYVEVVKFLQQYNTSFRVLALTATPGSSVEAVQEVIDGLNISKVEIRTEESLDIREYVHSRNIEIETFDYSEDMIMCMDLFGKSLQPVLDKLRSQNAHWAKDPMTLTPYGLTVARKDWLKSPAGRNANNGLKGMVHAIFSVLSSLAHAIDLLKYHGIGPFYRNLVSFQNALGAGGSKYQRQIVDDENFKTLMHRLRMWTNNEDFIGHPKLEFLKRVVLNHFMDAEKDGDDSLANRHPSSTRIMVFAHFRDSAEEIVRVLKRHGPMIRPHVFVGQAAAKGSGGMDQKTQLDIIEKFKEGTYNTIVATSVGEEGLDIGEVDLIVCYDSSASPIRMLQRMGRTGRKRRGNIVLLLMKGKEEDSFTKAKDNYEKMQQMIASGARFTFHDDKSPRILPRDIHPAVDERQIDIPVENSQTDLPEPTKRARVPKRLPKKFHMPDGVETGFTKASRISGMKVSRKATTERLRKPPPKVVEIFDIPPLDEVLLSKDERRELEQRYCSIGGTSPQFVSRPRIDAYPEFQRSYRPTKFVKHGAVTCRLVKAFQNMNALTTDCAYHFKAHLHPDDLTEQYEAVALKGTGRRKHPSFLRVHEKCPDPPDPDRQIHHFNNGSQPFSPLMRSQYSPQCPPKDQYLSSQGSAGDDLELPDVETLFNQLTGKRTAEHEQQSPSRGTRGKLCIVSDDSDDFDI